MPGSGIFRCGVAVMREDCGQDRDSTATRGINRDFNDDHGTSCENIVSFLLFLAGVSTTFAGPPFFTDDPEPVDFHHWEFYLASEQQHLRQMASATLPHVEVNYGAFPNVQLHLVAPLEYVRAGDVRHYGYSDTELGVKYRLFDETEGLPQVGIFPLVEVPTGAKDKQLGSGTVQVYLPLWFQKSWGKSHDVWRRRILVQSGE